MSKLLVLLLPLLAGGIEQDIFIFRGDIDGNNVLNLTDAIYLNNYLFLGGPQPPTCEEVWDVNDDDTVNGADSIFLLNYLFQGGAPPTPVLVDCE
jgi:hypothetical protein